VLFCPLPYTLLGILEACAHSAAQPNLVDHGSITVSQFPWRGRDHNRYHLVPEVWDAAWMQKDKDEPCGGDYSLIRRV